MELEAFTAKRKELEEQHGVLVAKIRNIEKALGIFRQYDPYTLTRPKNLGPGYKADGHAATVYKYCIKRVDEHAAKKDKGTAEVTIKEVRELFERTGRKANGVGAIFTRLSKLGFIKRKSFGVYSIHKNAWNPNIRESE